MFYRYKTPGVQQKDEHEIKGIKIPRILILWNTVATNNDILRKSKYLEVIYLQWPKFSINGFWGMRARPVPKIFGTSSTKIGTSSTKNWY